MINSTTSTDRTLRTDTVASTGPAAPRQAAPRPDQLSTDSAAFLRSELERQPEIRPDVVERARALAADANYPSREVLSKVGEMILRSPDLSEDES
jgi:hypothetical protein